MISGISQNSLMTTQHTPPWMLDGSDSSSDPAAPTTTVDNSSVTKNMFLQLLVAQIKNQDPMSPADGVQFLTQLAQFQQLEQSMSMGQDVAAIRTDMEAPLPAK